MRRYTARTSGYIYFIHCPKAHRLKIGFTVNVKRRMQELQSGCPLPMEILKYVRAEFVVEHVLLLLFDKWRRKHEWFLDHPELLKFIRGLTNNESLSTDKLAKKIIAKK